MDTSKTPIDSTGKRIDTRDEPCDVVVYTLGWETDRPTGPGEEPEAQIYCRVFVNGIEVKRAAGISVRAEADFLKADLTLYPSKIEFVPLDKDAWATLGKEL